MTSLQCMIPQADTCSQYLAQQIAVLLPYAVDAGPFNPRLHPDRHTISSWLPHLALPPKHRQLLPRFCHIQPSTSIVFSSPLLLLGAMLSVDTSPRPVLFLLPNIISLSLLIAAYTLLSRPLPPYPERSRNPRSIQQLQTIMHLPSMHHNPLLTPILQRRTTPSPSQPSSRSPASLLQ